MSFLFSSNFAINDVSYSVVPFCLDYYVVTLELEQLPLVDWMTNYLMTQMLTTTLYTYRPEERMQMQRMDDISSPAVRIHYTKRPHVFTLRLSWTRRQESAPAPEERREAARVL